MIPRTTLLCAPDKALNQLGIGMQSADLIRGLKMLNSRVVIPLPEHYEEWYPGKRAGQTCIWLGPPGHFKSSKICAFHLGMIPEFTQIDAIGIVARGWRSILDLCIRRRLASKLSIERVFRVNMDVGGKDTLCRICRKDGLQSPVDGKADVCEAHRNAQMNLQVHRERKKASAWNREHPLPPRRGPYVFHTRRQHAKEA